MRLLPSPSSDWVMQNLSKSIKSWWHLLASKMNFRLQFLTLFSLTWNFPMLTHSQNEKRMSERPKERVMWGFKDFALRYKVRTRPAFALQEEIEEEEAIAKSILLSSSHHSFETGLIGEKFIMAWNRQGVNAFKQGTQVSEVYRNSSSTNLNGWCIRYEGCILMMQMS